MAYATKADIDQMYGPELLTSMLADDIDQAAAVASALAKASTEIDTYLSARYSLPLKAEQPALEMPAINIAVYNLANRHTFLTDTIRQRYEDAIALLKRIGDGKAGLGAGEPSVSTGDGGTAEDGAAFFAPERIFTRGGY